MLTTTQNLPDQSKFASYTPGKQLLTKFKHCNWSISIFSKSREKRLITKEYIATDMHLNFGVKRAFTLQHIRNKPFQQCYKVVSN